MPVTTSFPGVYIEELPSTSRTVAAAPTSIAVFVGYTHPYKTPPSNVNRAVELFSFTDYEREFGGLYNGTALDANVANAVNQFFMNGGAQAYVVGLKPNKYGDGTAPANLTSVTAAALAPSGVTFTAKEPTSSVKMSLSIDNVVADTADVTISYGTRPPEVHRGVSVNAKTAPTTAPNANFIDTRMAASTLVTVTAAAGATFTATPTGTPITLVPNAVLPAVDHITQDGVTFALKAPTTAPVDITISTVAGGGKIADITVTRGTSPPESFLQVSTDANVSVPSTTDNPNYIVTRLQNSEYVSASIASGTTPAFVKASTDFPGAVPPTATTTFNPADFSPVFETDSDLDKLPIFNILVLPGIFDNGVLSQALAFAEKKRAFVILDPPPNSVAAPPADSKQVTIATHFETAPRSPNGALYFPYLKTGEIDPITRKPVELPPSGYVAGIYARTDNNRGVWKAPAGLETTVLNTVGVNDDGRMNDPRQGVLNLAGINCLRTFPGVGTVVFGARTLVSANPSFEQWKYVPVRRMALFIEQTLYRALTWAVFEPNDEPLWVALRTSVENFMLSLFNRGAFQGSKPSEAFIVRCDHTTTTQTDINLGVVNIIVAFAPLKPAEFVIVKIAQLAGQAQ